MKTCGSSTKASHTAAMCIAHKSELFKEIFYTVMVNSLKVLRRKKVLELKVDMYHFQPEVSSHVRSTADHTDEQSVKSLPVLLTTAVIYDAACLILFSKTQLCNRRSAPFLQCLKLKIVMIFNFTHSRNGRKSDL